MRIILIDDELKPISVYIYKLEKLGHIVVHVRTTDKVEEVLKIDKNFDWVILDIMMPPGKILKTKKTNGGLLSGEFLIDIIHNLLPNVKLTILTNVNDVELLKRLSDKVEGRCFKKHEISPNKKEKLLKLIS